MNQLSRRRFLQLSSNIGLLAALGIFGRANANTVKARVVIVGGGFGGATCAKYLRHLDPSIEVTLIERHRRYVTCPFSNLVIAGELGLADITFDYRQLVARFGVKLRTSEVIEIDAPSKTVRLQGGERLPYDRLIVAPGIDMRWDGIEGYDQAASEVMPHAWKAGVQTTLLRNQLRAMPDGGQVLIAVPENPFRCPPGPYERASLIAAYLKRHKPHARIVLLDSKEGFTKQALFLEGWRALYGDMIRWVPFSEDGKVIRVDAKKRSVYTEFERYRPDVANIIPPQQAGAIAQRAGLTNPQGWCPVDYRTFESTLAANIHVLGDACSAEPMPKSGFAANSQGKICAFAIVNALNGERVLDPVLMNTCYSLLSTSYAVSVAGVYRMKEAALYAVPGAGGVSPLGAPELTRKQEADYARGWYRAIIRDVFG